MPASQTEQLVVSLEARIRDFERNFQKANRTANDNFRSIERRGQEAGARLERSMASAADRSNTQLGRIGTGLTTAGTAFRASLAGFAAGAISGLSLEGVTKTVADLAAVNDVAQRTGASAKFIQEFGFAVRQSGGDADDATKGLQKFAVNVSKAAQGSGDLAKLFEANGVALTDKAGKLRPVSELLGELAELIKNAASEEDRLNIATMAFGKSAGPALVLALAEGRDGLADMADQANKAGAVLGDKLVADAAKLDDQMAELSDSVSGLGKQFAVEFAGPVLGAALEAMLSKLRELRDVIGAIRNMDLGKLGEFLLSRTGPGALYDALKTEAPTDELGKLEAQKADVEARIKSLSQLSHAAPGASETAKAKIEELKKSLAAIEESIKRINASSIDVTPSRTGYTSGETQLEEIKVEGKPTVLPSADSGGGADQSKVFKLIAAFESFRSNAYWDVNHWRAGYGSDTTTRASGAVETVTKNTVVSMADATRDLSRRIAEFQAGVRGKLGGSTFDAMSEEQQASLTSIAYNYGELPDRIVKAILGGASTAQIATAISGLGRDNGGVNQRRRDEEAELFQGNATFSQKITDKAKGEQTAEIDRKAEAITKVITALSMETDQLSRTEQQQRVYQELQNAGVDINSREGQAIAAKVQQLYALKTAQEATTQSTQQANQAREMLANVGADATKGIISDLRQGKTAAEAFANALEKIADKLISMAVDNLFKSAFAAPAGGGSSGGGGFFGLIGGLFGLKDGGLIDARRMPAFATGGYVSGPGGPRSDSIMARLSDGEYVINAKAVKEHRPVLEAINSGMVPKFAAGGPVGRGGSRGMIGKGGDTNVRMGDINLTMPASSGDTKKDADFAERTSEMVRNAVREEIGQFFVDESRPGGMIVADRS